MQKRRVISNKQHSTATPSQKPELPTSEPPYEVIEFPSQQQYTNALPLRNVQKAGSEKMVQRKCDLCGCSNAQFFCDICVQQTFCASCDQMYHRHPKRQRHIRKRIQQPVEKGMEPPLPPKNEFNQAPIPPPRRNKRTARIGTPNTLSQGTLKKNGSLMGSLKRIMGGIQSNTPQSTLNRNIAKSPNPMPHSSSATDSDRQSGSRRFGYLDWNADTRQARSGSFSAFNGPFPSLVQAQSMAQLNCPSCHHQGRSSWDWNRSQMNLNALPPWTGLAAGNPWHGSIIIPPPYPMMANDEFARRDSFHSQRSGRYRKPPAKFRAAGGGDDDSDFSVSDDRQSSRKATKSPHLPRTASPALSRRSRRTVASESEDDSASRRSDHHRYKRRTLPAASADCSPAASRRGYRNTERNLGRVKKYVEEDDAVSMKSVGSRRSVKSCRSYLLKSRHHSSSDSDDELTSDKDAGEMKMAEVGIGGGSSLQRGSPSKERSARRSSPSEERGSEDWQCEHCTYLNSSKCKVCDVCCKSRAPTKSTSTTSPPKEDVALESSMKNMRISAKSDQKKKGNERKEEKPIKSISTGTSPPPQTTSTQTYDIPQYSGKRNRSLSCEDYSDWNPSKKTNSILSSSSGKQSSFQQDSSQSSEYIHSLLQTHVKHGAEIVKLLKEAELHHFELEDVTAALAQCGDENPIKWLLENWNKMIDTVVTLATNYGREQVENTIGTISSIEAQAALRKHNGDIWAAVTECIRQRQTKYTKLMSRGVYSREDVVTVLTANHGNLEAAYKELSKSQLKPFLMKIWGPPQGLDNDSGDISKLHYKDHEYDSENGPVEIPSDKQDFNRIQSWLDTAATSSTDFDELLQFEDILTNLRKQSNPNNINKFSSHPWQQRPQNLGALQNERLSRYSSCDNLKNIFDNILDRKKCYASTDMLSFRRTKSKKDPLQLNPSRIKNRENNDFSDFQHSNEPEQHMSRRSHLNNSTQNVEINESEVENPLQNCIKNYLNNECTRQDTQYAYSVLSEDTKDYIDLNDGLIEIKKIVSQTNKRLGSTDQAQNKADHPATPTQPIQKNKLFGIKPHFIRQNSQTLASQNNVNPFEAEIGQKFDIREKSDSLIKVLIPAKNINFENNIQNGLYLENALDKTEETFWHRSQGVETENKLETSTKKYQEKENNDFTVEEDKISKTEETLPKYFEENEIFENVDESKNSKARLSHQKNEFCIRQQNLRSVVKVETSLLAGGSENLNIPNAISEQSNKNSSKSFSSNSKLKAAPLSCGPGNQTENEILQAELNALYWLAKCHLDFHIIETKDAPLHSAIIPKTCINDDLEITGSKIVLEFDEIKFQNSSSKDRNEYEENNTGSTPAMKNDIREAESPSRQTGVDIASSISEKNTDFLVDREESKVSKSQNEVINNTKSPIIEIIIDESMRLLSEKEQVETSENQHKNRSNLRKKTSNKEKEFILGDKNIEKPINQIIHTIADTIIQNKEEDLILLNGESQSPSNQNEPYTTEINLGNKPSECILSRKGNAERLSNKNEIYDNAKNLNSVSQYDRSHHPVEKKTDISKRADNDGDTISLIEMNGEGYQFNTEKAKISRRDKISIVSNLILDDNLLTENEEENTNKNEEFEVPSMKLGNEINDNEVETDNHPISNENNDNLKSDNFPFSEIENKHEVPQISNQHQFLLKSNNPVIKETSELTDFVKNENSCDVSEEIKFGQEISDTSPNNKKLTETRNRLARKISSSRLALIENLETERNERSPNEVQENQTHDEINKLYQSKSDTVAAKGFENSTIVLKNGSTDETDALTEPNRQISSSFPNNATGNYSEIINRENPENYNVDSYTSSLEAEARHFLTEGVVSTIDQAELVAQLMQLKFDRSQSIDAAIECSSIYSAIVYLQQECHLCTEKFSMKQMISLLECEHKCCQECARQFFSLQINEKSIEHCVCPFCEEPKLSQLDSDAILNYFSNLDILLKTILEPEIHELFQQKLRDRTLMQDPSFKWCSKCSFGFIADLDQKRLSCPSCKAISCANCGKLWTMEHHGKSCEQYNKWLATQNDSNTQFVNYLEENGITCPKCDTKFILVKGGCMHLTCTHCKYEFCSDCLKPFSMGADCKHSDYCVKLGLHAHHPRNCLFYLRDKEPGELKQLLLEHNIELNLQKSTEKRCSVQLQRETEDGLIDMKCSAQVEEGGLCRCHLREYLSRIICQNKLETINLLTLDELETVVLREGKKRPPRCYGMPEDDYYNALYQRVLILNKFLLCLYRIHYIEYLASLIRKNKIDPVTILDLTEILQEFRRQGKSLPIRSANSFEHEYRKHCIEIVKEEIPLG